MFKKVLLIIAFTWVVIYAQTPLSGAVENLRLTADKGPYIIENNLHVKVNNQVIIEKGCILLFKSFTGIVVDGSLIVEGTLKDPVVFTTVNDSSYNSKSTVFANPFDWNGILINEIANNVKLVNFVLAYSVYGVRSMKEGLTITNGSFKNNGQFHFTVNDNIKPVADGIPYSYGKGKHSDVHNRGTANIGKLAFVCMASGLICGAGSASSGIILSNYRNSYSKINDIEKLRHNEKIIKVSFAGTITLGTAAAILLPAALVIQKKKNTEDQKNVQFLPVYKEGPGIIAQLLF
ncbi:MAG: hypothetical protein JW915_08445 [Chitinispirillaceae bacterium]|nr:hypothetical protein [Chitinispirillaceae bacterium]